MTMKRICLIVLLSIICAVTSAQKMYEITPEIAKKISEGTDDTNGTEFHLYHAAYQDVKLPVFDTTLVETEDYKKLQIKILQLGQDSVAIFAKYQKNLIAFEDNKTILINIDSFLVSKESYKISKKYLKNAQVTATKLGINDLIYADKSINDKYLSEYTSKRLLDEERFKFALNRVKSSIANRIQEPRKTEFNNITYDLKTARENLLLMENNHLGINAKYEQKIAQTGTIVKNTLMKLSPISDYSQIVGRYKLIGENYSSITVPSNGYIINQIITDSDIDKYDLYDYSERSSYYSSLFENMETKELYYGKSLFFDFCDQEFILTVAVEKIKQLGYEISKEGTEIYIHANNIKLLFTNDIYKNLDKDKDYIKRLSLSISSYLKYSEQFSPLAKEMANHYQAWRSNTINYDRIEEWKSVTKKAQVLNEKLKNLDFNTLDNSYNYNKQLPSSVIDAGFNFYAALSKSIEMLGL